MSIFWHNQTVENNQVSCILLRKLSESCEEVIKKQQKDIVANKKRLNGPEGQFSEELVLHKSVQACIFNSNICCLNSGQLAKYNHLQY